MKRLILLCVTPLILLTSLSATAQVYFTGRVWAPRLPGTPLPENDGIIMDYFKPENLGIPEDLVPIADVQCYASQDDAESETSAFRSWATAPAGWYRLSGMPGKYTFFFTRGFGYSMGTRPVVVTNQFTVQGDRVDRKFAIPFDYAVFWDRAWDSEPAREYYQTFVAKGVSVTHVGFKVATDGIDGYGPGGQNIIVSVHRKGPGTPDTWEQVGPAMPVFNVDSGGAKSYEWYAGWNSGEVPVTPGETYAVHLRAEDPENSFQMFWHPDKDRTEDCYRIGADGSEGYAGADVWMAVGTDRDGLLVPYNKRIQQEYKEFGGFAKTWSQTYVARGRGLAGIMIYGGCLWDQPSMNRQRLAVRVRKGGADGPVVGPDKIAIGNGLYTGDASWGTFGAAFAPGEVPLEPGETYAIEFESIENYASLYGYVNIKGATAEVEPGFNPYRKVKPDSYANGTAFLNGKEEMDFDLDMVVVEYEHHAGDWENAVDPENLIANGHMESGDLDSDDPSKGSADSWTMWALDEGTEFAYLTDGPDYTNRILRVVGGAATKKTVDGGFVQQIDGLTHMDTYRLSGKVRSSWPVDFEHVTSVGYDLTGQVNDPDADTIHWTPFSPVHSVFYDYASGPIRPEKDAISVWLRGKTTMTGQYYPYRADFDDFALHRVKTGVPGVE
jgi:hypothetical protein